MRAPCTLARVEIPIGEFRIPRIVPNLRRSRHQNHNNALSLHMIICIWKSQKDRRILLSTGSTLRTPRRCSPDTPTIARGQDARSPYCGSRHARRHLDRGSGQSPSDYKDDDLADLPSHTRGCRLSGSTIRGWKSIPRRHQARAPAHQPRDATAVVAKARLRQRREDA